MSPFLLMLAVKRRWKFDTLLPGRAQVRCMGNSSYWNHESFTLVSRIDRRAVTNLNIKLLVDSSSFSFIILEPIGPNADYLNERRTFEIVHGLSKTKSWGLVPQKLQALLFIWPDRLKQDSSLNPIWSSQSECCFVSCLNQQHALTLANFSNFPSQNVMFAPKGLAKRANACR